MKHHTLYVRLKKVGNVLKKILLWALVLCLLLCSGCAPQRKADTPLCKVVTRIQITREQDGDSVSHCYTDSQSMKAILSYLRRLKPYSLSASALPEVDGECYRITLDYSDGTQHSYRQLGSGYFQDSSGKWKQIDQELGKDLTLLFDELPGGESLRADFSVITGFKRLSVL